MPGNKWRCAMLVCSSHALSHTFRFSTLFALRENNFDEWFAVALVWTGPPHRWPLVGKEDPGWGGACSGGDGLQVHPEPPIHALCLAQKSS